MWKLSIKDDDRTTSIMQELSKKYVNRMNEHLGVGIALKKLISVGEYEIIGSILRTKVIFTMVFRRFLEDEICTGVVIEQSSEKLLLKDKSQTIFEVEPKDMFEEMVFNNECWVWKYKNHNFRIPVGGMVRVRVKSYNNRRMVVESSMDEQGLGLIQWWE